MRRYFAAGIWLTLTVTATVIVWAAVSVVAADVTDRPAPVVGHRDVVVALQAGSSRPVPTTTVTTTPARPSLTNPSGPASGTVTPATRAAPSTPTKPSTATTTTTVPATTTTTKPPARVPAPTTTTTMGATATYSTNGGVVAVACTGFNSIRLVAALPYDGFQAVVLSGGPIFVAVSFVSATRNVSLSAACFFGQPFEYTQGQGTPANGPPTTPAPPPPGG